MKVYVIKTKDGKYISRYFNYKRGRSQFGYGSCLTQNILTAKIFNRKHELIYDQKENLEYKEVTIAEGDLEKEIADLKRENQELLGKLYEQIVDEHRPAFCKLAGRDCPALNKTEGETE